MNYLGINIESFNIILIQKYRKREIPKNRNSKHRKRNRVRKRNKGEQNKGKNKNIVLKRNKEENNKKQKNKNM